MDRRRQVQHGLVGGSRWRTQGIVPNGDGEPVCTLTPHQRDSQPEGETERERERTGFVKAYSPAGWLATHGLSVSRTVPERTGVAGGCAPHRRTTRRFQQAIPASVVVVGGGGGVAYKPLASRNSPVNTVRMRRRPATN